MVVHLWRLWVELFVLQDLIQDSLGLFDGHSLICCNTPCFYWKVSSWSKDNKDGNLSQHNCCLISVLQSSGRNFLHPGCARKQVTNMTGQLSLTSFLRYCNDQLHLSHVPWVIFLLQIYCELVLGTLGMLGNAHQKWYCHFIENFRVYLKQKNQLHPPCFSKDGLSAFWPITRESEFFQIWGWLVVKYQQQY